MFSKNLEKCDILKKNRKKSAISKILSVEFLFKSTRPICNHLYFISIKTELIFFLFQKVESCMFEQKNCEVKDTFRNTTKLLTIEMHLLRQNSF